MKLKKRAQTSIGQFITRKAQSYTPLQRVLVALAGVLIAGFLVSVVAVVVIVASGALVSDPSTAHERNLIVAQARYRSATKAARERGANATEYIPAIQAKARIVLLQAQTPATQANARKAADELVNSGTLDPLALYACAKAYQTDPTRRSEARLLFAKAAHNVGDKAGSLSRTIYAAYAASLSAQKLDKQASVYLQKAAEIAPASPRLYVLLGASFEKQAQWYDAAVAYVRALKFDPHNREARAALEKLAQSQPDRVKAARAEVK